LVSVAFGSDAHLGTLDTHASIAMAVMVIGGTVLAYLFWGIGIARLGAAKTSIFLNLVPVFAMLIESMLGTLPSADQLIGGLLVIVGVSITMFPSRRPVAIA
jgi:drug/metabolite transporter (DMT)-like permease